MSTLFDFLSNIKTVITLRFEHRALATLKQKVAAIYPVFRHYTVLNEWKWFSMDMLMSIVVCIIITSYLYQQFILGTTILIGTITMLWQYIEKMKMAFENFTRQRGELMQLSANFDTIDDIETAYQEQTVNESLHAWQDTTPIHIRHLHFSYKDQHKQTRVLHDISLNLHRGERIALVGSSGSGKSTLMMVLR